MTRRERLERKAEKRREWAEGRTSKAHALRNATSDSLRHDWAFITQPGHIPERARMIRRDDKAHEHHKMATHHEQKAAGIEAQLDRSIFSDDDDAIERLAEKIADLEAERDSNKGLNAAWRKAGKPKADDAPGWARIAELLNVEADSRRITTARIGVARDFMDRAPFPPYVGQNLGGRIKQAKDRIEDIKRRRERTTEAEEAGGVVVKIAATPGGGWAVVTFAEKPGRDMLRALRAACFRWSGGSWHGPAPDLPDELKQGAE